jgi:cytochrome P450
MVIDECTTFMLGATQTLSLLIYNALYYFTKLKDIREKAMTEIKKVILGD